VAGTGSARVTARIALGRALREQRESAGLSGVEAGRRLGWSQSKVSRIEAARVRAEVEDVRPLLDLYGVSGSTRSRLLQLAEDAAGPASEWRNSTRVGLPRRQQDFVAFEAAATAITHYQPMIIPGPMQTRSYAERVLAIVGHPDPERAIETRRARRSAIFVEGGPSIRIVLPAQAVHWNPGPDGVLAEQLQTVADLAEQFGADLRVIPLDVEQRAFLAHPAVVYDLAGQEPQAIVETTTMDVRVTDSKDVEVLRRRIDAMISVALSRADSISYVRQVATRLETKWRR
jgi:transcriptional regulator with XRE-family HTH domain